MKCDWIDERLCRFQILALSRLEMEQDWSGDDVNRVSGGGEGWRKALAATGAMVASRGKAGLTAAPSPPREPMDPVAIRRYCGRTSVSGRESSSRS